VDGSFADIVFAIEQQTVAIREAVELQAAATLASSQTIVSGSIFAKAELLPYIMALLGDLRAALKEDDNDPR
jgi:hypothetical protein